jgi:hypothetical protein
VDFSYVAFHSLLPYVMEVRNLTVIIYAHHVGLNALEIVYNY